MVVSGSKILNDIIIYDVPGNGGGIAIDEEKSKTITIDSVNLICIAVQNPNL
jgi:hypothetical protein